jgi:NAD(P)-dependent dehydrogenase (short-subunit alcohol dehydrogenase family)
MNKGRRLENKVAVITGACSGIGQATARLFAREGARLVLTDVSETGLRETMEQVGQEGQTGAFRIVGVSIEEQVRDLVRFAVATYSTMDILCNNAGIPGGLLPIDEQDSRECEKVFSVNMMGAVFGTKYVVPVMRRQKKGAIVNT